MKHTLTRRLRLRLALSELPLFCIQFWTILIFAHSGLFLFATFLRASRSFPFRLFTLNAMAAGCIQLLMNPEPNWVRFAVTQASGFAVAVTYYGLQHIHRAMQQTSTGGGK